MLDTEHVGVDGRLGDECLDRVGERVVGVVQQHVSLSEDREDVRALVVPGEEPWRGDRRPRLGVQVGSVDREDRPKTAQPDRRVNRVDGLGPQVELAQEQLAHRVGHAVLDLEAHRSTEAAAAQLHLECDEQVLGLFFFECEVGVAGDAERLGLAEDHAGKERVEVRGDDLLDGDESVLVGELEESRQDRGHLHPGDPLLGGRGVPDLDGDVEREIRDHGEGMPRIDGERGEDRVDVALEELAHRGAVVVFQLLVGHDVQPCLREVHAEVLEVDPVLAPDELGRALADRDELLAGPEAVCGPRGHAADHLVLESRDADLEELVEQLGEDRHELHTLEQGHRGVLGEVEQPGAEVEARQLPVGEALRSELLNGAELADERGAELAAIAGHLAEILELGSGVRHRSSA